MVFNITFNNISFISWWSVLLVEEIGVTGETPTLPQVTGKLYHECCIEYTSYEWDELKTSRLADGVQGRISINFLIASIALNTDVNWGKKCHIGNKNKSATS
jgi:hypothetical protein